MKRRSTISVAAAVRRAIVMQAKSERPNECCGLLVGAGHRIEFAVTLRNIEASATHYRIDDAAHLELRRVLRTFVPARSVVGVYHSHPAGDPKPSPTDVARAMYPEWLYLIVGLKSHSAIVRAFRITGGRVRELRIRWR